MLLGRRDIVRLPKNFWFFYLRDSHGLASSELDIIISFCDNKLIELVHLLAYLFRRGGKLREVGMILLNNL